MLRMLKAFVCLLVVATVGFFSTGCGSSHSQVRIVNAAPDAGAFDVLIDSKTLATGLAFETVSPSTGYASIGTGNLKIEARPTGTTTDTISSNFSFGGGNQYTVIALGRANPSTLAAVVLTDDNTAPASGDFKLRVVHASPSAPTDLDVYVVAPGTDITSATPMISSVAYQQASAYQSIPAASLEVIVTANGDSSKTRLVDQTFTFSAAQVRTLVLIDQAGGGIIAATPMQLADVN